VSFLAVVNLLALSLFVVWLWGSQRLDQQRLVALRELFAPTIPEERAAAAEEARAEEARRRRQAEQASDAKPALSSADSMRASGEMQEQASRISTRLSDEAALFLERLELREKELDRREAAFTARESAWEKSRRDEEYRRTDEQFAQAVGQLERLKPKQAKAMIVQLVTDGKRQEALAYLDAMNERAAAKILSEFNTDQERQLATELLEGLRTLGLTGGVAPELSNANLGNPAP
jgi:hypothetical protein